MSRVSYREVKERAPKVRDNWSRKLIADPIAIPLTYLIARYTPIKPIDLTVLAFIYGMLAAVAFGLGLLVPGAVCYYVHFLIDAMDGKLSRTKKEDDTYRGSLDFLGDGIIDVAVVLGISVSLYSDEMFLLWELLLWMSISFLIHRFTSLSYYLMNQLGIQSKEFISSEMKSIYGDRQPLKLYYYLSLKLDKLGLNVLPSAAESSILIFIVGPLLWYFTHNIDWMYLLTALGILLALPITLGAGIIAYQLSRRKPNA